MSVLVFEGFLSTPEMLAVLDKSSIVQAMMDFEAALARAQGRVGVIPQSAAQAIASLCRVELYDIHALMAASAHDGSLAIPVVRRLAETVALFDPAAASFVHLGSTSQDVIDTAQVLLARRGLRLIEDDLLELVGVLLDLADAHPAQPILARTLMQPAQVSSLRFRLASWALPLLRCAQGLRHAADGALQLQFGGAVGTLSALGEQAEAVSQALGAELKLPVPDMPWHSQRDRWVRLCAELGVLCGSLGKLARDVSLLSQAEIGEMAEPEDLPPLGPPSDGLACHEPAGAVPAVPPPSWLKPSAKPAKAGALDAAHRGLPAGLPLSVRKRSHSRAMPHKRNPVSCMLALAAAQRAPQRVGALLSSMLQEFERGLGGWQAELAESVSLLMHSHGSVRAMLTAMAGITLYPGRMAANIEAQQGLVYSEALTQCLAGVLGRVEAQSLVGQLCDEVLAAHEFGDRPAIGCGLRGLAEQLCARDARLRASIEPTVLAAVFDPIQVAQHADQRVSKALAQARVDLSALLARPQW